MKKNTIKKRITIGVASVLSVVLIAGGIISYSFFKPLKQYEREAFVNAKIYTVDEANPWAESMIIENERIVFIGSEEEAKKHIDKDTRVHDVKGKLILPGFIDSHAHVGLTAGQMGIENALIVDASSTPKQLLEDIKKYAKQNKEEKSIVGMGFDSNQFGENGPTAIELDNIDSTRPIILIDGSGHTAWANSKAMEIAEITKNTPDPVPGLQYFKRDEGGHPTGWLVESQTFLPVLKKLNIMTADNAYRGGEKIFPLLSSLGITTAYDAGMMGFEDELFGGLAKLEKDEKLPLRVFGSYMIQSPTAVPNAVTSLQKLNKAYNTNLIQVDTMKIHYDGTLETKNAAMMEPFGPTNSYNGEVLFDKEMLAKLISDVSHANFNTHIHAVGDKATSDALDAIEDEKRSNPNNKSRIALAHVQFFQKDTVERFAKLKDVIVQTTPNWLMPFDGAEEWVGKERYELQGLYNSLDKASVKLSFGSDFPVNQEKGVNVFYNMYVGHTRQNPDDATNKVLPPESEKLTLETLVKGYTINGAYQLGVEKEIGSLEIGKKADFIIVKSNIFEETPEQLLKNKVIQTYMDGNLVFERGIKDWFIENFAF